MFITDFVVLFVFVLCFVFVLRSLGDKRAPRGTKDGQERICRIKGKKGKGGILPRLSTRGTKRKRVDGMGGYGV